MLMIVAGSHKQDVWHRAHKKVLKMLEGIRVEIEGYNLPIALSAGWAELLLNESADLFNESEQH